MRAHRSKHATNNCAVVNKLSRGLPIGRVFASVFILLVILLACFWVPFALAQTAPSSTDEYGSVASGADNAGSVSDGSADPAGSDSTSAGSVADTSGGNAGNAGTDTADQAADSDAGADDRNAATAVYGGDTGDSAAEDEYFDLHLECNYGIPGVFWASRADYDAGLLSINYHLTNTGPGVAKDVTVTGATATNGVTIWTDPLPMLGDLGSGDSLTFTLKWLVPKTVKSFQTTLTICAACGDKGDDDETIDDTDDDGIDDPADNCPAIANPDQADKDQDGIGDACDTIDDSNDDDSDNQDDCSQNISPDQPDSDGDGISDACDPIDDSQDLDNGDITPVSDPAVIVSVPESVQPIQTSTVNRDALPTTGFSLLLSFALVLALMMLYIGFRLVPVARRIRSRDK